MSLKEIVKIPNKILTTKCEDVKKFDDETMQIIRDLEETLWETKDKGVGLAAPQIGYNKKICAVHKINEKTNEITRFIFVNPKIKNFSTANEIEWEGCLSIPDVYCRVKRSKEITLEYLDKLGNKNKIKAAGFFARVIQHEIDHLNGILITEKCIGEPKTEQELDKILGTEEND